MGRQPKHGGTTEAQRSQRGDRRIRLQSFFPEYPVNFLPNADGYTLGLDRVALHKGLEAAAYLLSVRKTRAATSLSPPSRSSRDPSRAPSICPVKGGNRHITRLPLDDVQFRLRGVLSWCASLSKYGEHRLFIVNFEPKDRSAAGRHPLPPSRQLPSYYYLVFNRDFTRSVEL
jgi:hypothetical protein